MSLGLSLSVSVDLLSLSVWVFLPRSLWLSVFLTSPSLSLSLCLFQCLVLSFERAEWAAGLPLGDQSHQQMILLFLLPSLLLQLYLSLYHRLHHVLQCLLLCLIPPVQLWAFLLRWAGCYYFEQSFVGS